MPLLAEPTAPCPLQTEYSGKGTASKASGSGKPIAAQKGSFPQQPRPKLLLTVGFKNRPSCLSFLDKCVSVPWLHPAARGAPRPRRREMALALSADEQCIIFSRLCNPLEPRVAIYFSGASHGLWAPTQALRQQLRADYHAAAALCCKVGMRSCKELREAISVYWSDTRLSAAELTTLGKLGSVLPALEELRFFERSASADCVQQLAAGLGAGALPAVTVLMLTGTRVGDLGAPALAAALGRGALPRLEILVLNNCGIGDAGLMALAPALRRLPALKRLALIGNPVGDEGLGALVAPLPPAGALSPPTEGLTKLKELFLSRTQITDAGCAALASALGRSVLPALKLLDLSGIAASAAAKAAVRLKCVEMCGAVMVPSATRRM